MLPIVMSLGNLKKSEIVMKPNQAYETVVRPQPAAQVHTEPDYEDVAQVHHWIWMYTTSTLFECIQLFLNANILEMILQMYKDIDLSNFIEFFCAMA